MRNGSGHREETETSELSVRGLAYKRNSPATGGEDFREHPADDGYARGIVNTHSFNHHITIVFIFLLPSLKRHSRLSRHHDSYDLLYNSEGCTASIDQPIRELTYT
jgi:hypothetical protein